MKIQTSLVILAAAWALSSIGFAQERLPAVAYVSLVVGQVSLVRSNGETLPVQRGLNLHESDRLVTGEDGMVMLVFVDEGRVALRSGSELLIRKYKYDTDGADSDLRLELLKGTIRQISGKAAKRQPERYHLNTPVAAIGVRGTDFLAKADNAAVRTYVHEGAITVQSRLAPQEPVLSKAGEGRYLMAYGEGHLEQHTLKLAELEQSFSIQLTPSAAGGVAVAKNQARTSAGNSEDASTSTSVLVTRASASVQTAQSPDWAGITLTKPELPPIGSGKPDVPDHVVELPEKQFTALVWGRSYENPKSLPLTLPLAYATASAGRAVTVGEPLAYALWREGVAGTPMAAGLNGTANFALAAGEGYYTSTAGNVQMVQLSDARLQVNFDRSQFQTSMNIGTAGLPNQHLQVGGAINTDGVFLGRAPNQRVAGALSLDGAQAGYLFQVDATGGAYKGITLWNKK